MVPFRADCLLRYEYCHQRDVYKRQYVTNGTGSPAVYSTADVSVSDATLIANNSEAVVVEGKLSLIHI